MCGICGVYKFPDGEPITEDQIKALLLGVQHRGGDATGIALQQPDGKVAVWKNDDIAHKAIVSNSFETFLKKHLKEDTLSFIGHTRAATQGNPRLNKNNHPLFVDKCAAVHNGCINNDDFLFRDLKLERGAETDSDIIRAIIDEEGITKKGIRTLGRMSGSCATAVLHPEYPGKLLLARSGSPCTCAEVGGNLMFASEKGAIHLASRTWFEWKGIWMQKNRENLAFNPMEGDTAWIIGPEGVEWHDTFRTCYNYTRPKYDVFGTFEAKKDRWDHQPLEEAKKVTQPAKAKVTTWVDQGKQMVMCPKVDCNNIMEITADVKAVPLSDLCCNKCKTPLASAKAA